MSRLVVETLRSNPQHDLCLVREGHVFRQFVQREGVDLAALAGDLELRRLGVRPETGVEVQATEGVGVVMLRDVLEWHARNVHEQLLVKLVDGGLEAGLGLDESARERPLAVSHLVGEAPPAHAHSQPSVRQRHEQHVDADRVRRDENEMRLLELRVRAAERVRLTRPLRFQDGVTTVLERTEMRNASIRDDGESRHENLLSCSRVLTP